MLSSMLIRMDEKIDVPVLASDFLPVYAHHDDAGADLRSVEEYVLAPGQRTLVRTGVKIALPAGYLAFVCPRSGLAVKNGVTVLNGPGVIDAGYRGEICVPLINLDPSETFTIHRGDRIAQMLIMPVQQANFCPVDSLDETERGEGGFGSTGVKE